MKFSILLLLWFPVTASTSDSNLQYWLDSEARYELISEFESNACRLTLTELSDILFEYDMSDEWVYAERLIRMEPEIEPLTFPVVLVSGETCKQTAVVDISVPESALEFAIGEIFKHDCSMEVARLEALSYPDTLSEKLDEMDRRNVVSEMYNRDWVTFSYQSADGVETLRVQSLHADCDKDG